MKEIWVDIKEFEGFYQVSNFGRIKSFKLGQEKILKQSIGGGGYLQGCFYYKSKQYARQTHKLVAIHFLNHKPCGHKLVINHKDFNKLNNRLDNLEIVTQRENSNLKHIKHSSKYTGVTWFKRDNKWRAQVWINGKNKHLGYFDTELEASRKYENFINKIEIV